MANESYEETINVLEKEKKTKQLANMISVQEGISYEKAYQRAQTYIAAGIERPYLGKMQANLNGLINNSCYYPGEEVTSRKIKDNVKKGKTTKEHFKKAITTGLMVAVIAGTTLVSSSVIGKIGEMEISSNFKDQIKTEYNLGDSTSFVSKNSKVSYSPEQEYFVITNYDIAAKEIYDAVNSDNNIDLDAILYNEFCSLATLGDLYSERSEDEMIDNQIQGFNYLLDYYKLLDKNESILDNDNFYTYVLRIVEKNYGLDSDTINDIKDSIDVTKSIDKEGKVFETPCIKDREKLRMLINAYDDVGLRMEKSFLKTERGR